MNAQVDDKILNQVSRADTETRALVLGGDSFDRMLRLADLMASGKATVPAHLQKNPADCMAIVIQSMQWGMNPFAVAQKTHLVSGVLGYEAQLVNAVITAMAPTEDRLHFEWFGPWEKIIGKFRYVTSQTKKDDAGEPKKYIFPDWEPKDEAGLGVRVWATFKGEDEPRVLELLLNQARTRNSTLWTEDPRQQLAYLATKRWSRLYCPDVIMGVYTRDELEPAEPPEERNMGRAVVEPEPEHYPEDRFAQNMPLWAKAVANGKGTMAAMIAKIRSKAEPTADQLDRLQKAVDALIENAEFEPVNEDPQEGAAQ